MNLNKITNFLFLPLLILNFCNNLHGIGKIQDLKQSISKKICRYRHSQKTLDMYFLAAAAMGNLQDIKFYHDCGANINAINNFSFEEWTSFARQTKYISVEHVSFFMDSIRRNMSALMITNYDNNPESIQNVIAIIKYLIAQGADINYTITENRPVPLSVFTFQSLRALTHINSAAILIILLKAGVNLSSIELTNIKSTSKIGKTLRTRNICEEILNYNAQIKLRKKKIKLEKDKIQRYELIREALQNTNVLPKVLLDLTGEYIEGEIANEEEEKTREEIK